MRRIFLPVLLLFLCPRLLDGQVPRRMIPTMDGKALFEAYCASCHGIDAKGRCPVAEVLKRKPSDLTKLAKRHGGKFPAAELEKTILGGNAKSAHGATDMPVWGPVFRQVENDMDLGLMRVHQLVEYLKKLQ